MADNDDSSVYHVDVVTRKMIKCRSIPKELNSVLAHSLSTNLTTSIYNGQFPEVNKSQVLHLTGLLKASISKIRHNQLSRFFGWTDDILDTDSMDFFKCTNLHFQKLPCDVVVSVSHDIEFEDECISILNHPAWKDMDHPC